MEPKSNMPRPPRQTGPSFPIIRPIAEGFGFIWQYKKMALGLAILPLIATLLAQYTVVAYFAESPFRAAIVQLPAEFILGLSCMIIVFFVMRDHDHVQSAASPQEENIKKLTGMKDRFIPLKAMLVHGYMMRSAIVAYALVNYIMSGFFATMVSLYRSANINIEELAKTEDAAQQQAAIEGQSLEIFLVLVIFVGLIWFLRYLWLPVLVAMGAPLRESYRKIGGMEGSVMIGVMFMMIIVMVLLGMSLILSLILPLFGVTSADNMPSAATFVRDGLSTLAMIFAQFVFMAASVHAIKAMNKPHKTSA